MQNIKQKHKIFFVVLCAMALCSNKTFAKESRPIASTSSAQEFLSRIQARYDEADKFMKEIGLRESQVNLRGLPEGEVLLFDISLPPRLLVEGIVFSEVYKDTILLSLNDFISVLHFPIEYNESAQSFSGWFIRENKVFDFDVKSRLISAGGQEYKLSNDAKITGNDVLVPISDIKLWFGMDVEVDVGTQRLALIPAHPLPATERFERRQKDYTRQDLRPPSKPYYDDGYDLIGVPVVDVSTRSTFRRPVNAPDDNTYAANIRTAGEFLYGTLNTNTAMDNRNHLSSARVSYLQESPNPYLLGPLDARRFEVGDITPTNLPITGSAPPETGVRITNADPLVNLTFPSTRIDGYFLSGWDVELYRENSLLAFQETDGEGYYFFDNIPLLAEQNVFRLVAYGPQGEIKEENISIPFDRKRVTDGGGIYDVSLTFQNQQFYRRVRSQDTDKNTAHLVGFYELPVFDESALRVGGRYRQEEGENKIHASAALSTSYAGALINSEIATDEKGAGRSEFSINKEFNQHRARMDISLASKNYNPNQGAAIAPVFSNRYNLEGPSPFKVGDNLRYTANLRYDIDSEKESTLNGFLGLNTQFKHIGVSQNINYSQSSRSTLGPQIGGLTSITGSFSGNIVRGLARYKFKPEDMVEGLTAFWKRKFNDFLETQIQVDRTLEDRITRYSTQLNWRPSYATITPRLTYDSEGNKEVTLSTRFSLAKAARSNSVIFNRDSLSNSGSLSAFVFLDKNGDRIFNEEDEPIEDVKIIAPHNSGGGKTDKNGVVYITQMRSNLLTDVYLDNGSLPDPYWIAADEGVSVLPLTGKNIELTFPVHVAGEIDGTIYKHHEGGAREPAQNIILSLYAQDGKLEQRTLAGFDGFYIFSLIPPGEYLLLIEGRNIPEGFGRPMPEKIKIGYDGTVIYGHDLALTENQSDIPMAVLPLGALVSAEGKTHKEKLAGNSVLNLGEFHSKLGVSYMWHILHKTHKNVIEKAKLLIPLNQITSAPANGKYNLRTVLPDQSVKSGFSKCREMKALGLYCKVEIVGALK